MRTPNSVLMTQARESLKGKWKLGVLASAIFIVISIAVSFIPTIAGTIISFLTTGSLTFGMVVFYLHISRNEEAKISQLFEGFTSWWRTCSAYLLMVLYIVLWSLLLIVPGIIASFSYAMTFYILADDRNISVPNALRKSKAMMKGNKWKLFCLHLRFIGWGLLCILTLGIGSLWLIPYMQVSLVRFYEDIKNPEPEANPTESI